MKIAAFDIGTTAVKGVLVSEKGECIASTSVNISTYFQEDHQEQDPLEWYEAFCGISRQFVKQIPAREIGAVIMSGQMQDMIPVDAMGMPVGRAVLYSDGRAGKEAEEIREALARSLGGEEGYAERVTGNHFDGSLSFPKILWMKKHQPEMFEKVYKVLISSKDYIIARLTGSFCGDSTACSTAGAMDIHKKQWDERILEAGGIGLSLMPKIRMPHEAAGQVSAKGALESGYREGTKVYSGVGDAGASTLASGISRNGEYNINLGTSGWVAMVSDEIFNSEGGVFNLAAMPEGKYINVVPFLNGGNVHKWAAGVFGGGKEPDYEKVDRLLEESVCGSRGVLFLPYLAGERFPVMDSKIRGCYYGISAGTTRSDLVRSCLEGVAFSIRQGIESIGVPPKKISVIGGGARVACWCQILAEVLNAPLYVYRSSETLPSLAIASAVWLANGDIKSYSDFTDTLQAEDKSIVYRPDPDNGARYDEIYKEYLKLYPAVCAMKEKDPV